MPKVQKKEPANDPHSVWDGDQLALKCDCCGSFRYWVFQLDGRSRVICVVCEKDHTDVLT